VLHIKPFITVSARRAVPEAWLTLQEIKAELCFQKIELSVDYKLNDART